MNPKSSPDEMESYPCVVSEKSLSAQGERQFLVRYADGAVSTHRATTRRFTSQIDGKEVQRTDEEAALVKQSIQQWLEKYPEDSELVKRLRTEREQRLAFWVRCVSCGKNRKMPAGVRQSHIKVRVWTCSMNRDLAHASCDVREEDEGTQECKHEKHSEWHPDVPRDQPLSNFYGRLKVCILCHKKRSYLKGSRRRVEVPSTAKNLIIEGTRTRKKRRVPGFKSPDEIIDLIEADIQPSRNPEKVGDGDDEEEEFTGVSQTRKKKRKKSKKSRKSKKRRNKKSDEIAEPDINPTLLPAPSEHLVSNINMLLQALESELDAV